MVMNKYCEICRLNNECGYIALKLLLNLPLVLQHFLPLLDEDSVGVVGAAPALQVEETL